MRTARTGMSVIVGLVLSMFLATAVLADDWEAIKLRGGVFVLVDNQWVQLTRGDVVPDNRVIRTAEGSRVQFRRGKETIDLGPNTQIRIFDRDGQKFTVVQEHFGVVAVEAERKNVQHFVVQTEFLAAVVKGTKFTVTSNAQNASVTVHRGQVEVRDTARNLMVDITPGQSASAGSAEVLSVKGSGTIPPIMSFSGSALAESVESETNSTPTAGGNTSTTSTASTTSPSTVMEDAVSTSTAAVEAVEAAPPGLVASTPGLSESTPADGAEPPGLAESTPGQTGSNPGKSGSAPGHNK